MSNIDETIVDPTRPPVPPPDSIVPGPDDDHVGSDAVDEPPDDRLPVEPDPEEGNDVPGGIERA